MSEKTELPSRHRLEQARRQGTVAHSRSLASVASLLGGLAALAASLPWAAGLLHGYFRSALAEAATGRADVFPALAMSVKTLVLLSGPVVIAAAAGGLLGSFAQVGFALVPAAISLRPERLSPGNGLARLFSKRNLFEAAKSAVALTGVLWVAWAAVKGMARLPAAAIDLPAPAAFDLLFTRVASVAFKAVLFALALGLLDLLFQRRAHLKSLMMSREDLKREHKEQEGDPHHKARRKAAHQAVLNGTAARGVAKATVLVVNPTHVAVALRYSPAEASAPTLVAKGIEDEAARLRSMARRLRVPIVRDIPLARALVRCDVGQEIPEELFEAAAVVLRQVYDAGQAPPPDHQGSPQRSAP